LCREQHCFEQTVQFAGSLEAAEEWITTSFTDLRLATALNQVISHHHCPYIIIDSLSLDYSFTKLLLPYKSMTAPAFSFLKVSAEQKKAAGRIGLADVLTTH